MSLKKPDRRTSRTEKSLETAFLELVRLKGYEAVSIQEIVERANVARATFYLHYQSKDDLFFHWLARFNDSFNMGLSSPDKWLGSQPTPQLIRFFQAPREQGDLNTILLTLGRDGTFIFRQMDQLAAQTLERDLQQCFSQAHCAVPFPVLAQAIGGVLTRLISWWLDKRAPFTAEEMAVMAQRMIRALVRDALER